MRAHVFTDRHYGIETDYSENKLNILFQRKRRFPIWFPILVMASLLIVTLGTAGAQCTSRNDCKGNRLCESGQCVDPANAETAVYCTTDKECSGDLVCKKKQCVQPSSNEQNLVPVITSQEEARTRKQVEEAKVERKRVCEDAKSDAEARALDKSGRCQDKCGDPRTTNNPDQWMRCYDRCLTQGEQEDNRIQLDYERCLRGR